jgi:dimethylaniline monooxygenase (N-oxide forming)
MRVAIIGGGPSGLVTLKTLITAHEFLPGAEAIEVKLFEQEEFIGGTFKYRSYEDAEVCYLTRSVVAKSSFY